MGNSFVIYLFIFSSRAALQSLSLPGVSGLRGGTLEFGARQTSYFLAKQAKAFEDEEGMERRGDAGMLQTLAGRSSAFPSGTEYFAGGADVSQAGRKTAPSPKEFDSGKTKRERKNWKKCPSHGPRPAPLPCASSRGGQRRRPGALHGCLHVETKASHVPRGVGRGVRHLAMMALLRQALHVPGDRNLPQNLKRNVAFAVLPLNLNPCSICISATVETNGISNSWGFLFQISFFSSLTSYLQGFDLNFAKLCLFRTYHFHCKLFSPYEYPSLCSRIEKRKKETQGESGMLESPSAITLQLTGMLLPAALREDAGCWKTKKSC